MHKHTEEQKKNATRVAIEFDTYCANITTMINERSCTLFDAGYLCVCMLHKTLKVFNSSVYLSKNLDSEH